MQADVCNGFGLALVQIDMQFAPEERNDFYPVGGISFSLINSCIIVLLLLINAIACIYMQLHLFVKLDVIA